MYVFFVLFTFSKLSTIVLSDALKCPRFGCSGPNNAPPFYYARLFKRRARSQALLNGVMKRCLLKDEAITVDYICTEIFEGKQTDGTLKFFFPRSTEDSPVSSPAEVTLIETLEKLLQQAAYANWSLTQLGEVLKKASISEEHASIFGKFWQSERDNIHKFLQSKKFNGHLEVRLDALTFSSYALTQSSLFPTESSMAY